MAPYAALPLTDAQRQTLISQALAGSFPRLARR